MNIITIVNRASVGRETKDFSGLLFLMVVLELFDGAFNEISYIYNGRFLGMPVRLGNRVLVDKILRIDIRERGVD